MDFVQPYREDEGDQRAEEPPRTLHVEQFGEGVERVQQAPGTRHASGSRFCWESNLREPRGTLNPFLVLALRPIRVAIYILQLDFSIRGYLYVSFSNRCVIKGRVALDLESS